ncbi:hypothetical protein H5P34_09020 [Mycobacterium porcinum]|uniref:Outer membrane protein n=1 Tax=Mycolicibacterium porcinum TaxID=39693 RepID=A0AAW5T008_9MYCO|nr:hypothetical protein [Mycolicibacterium porcinum]ORB43743.1 hypothetical protein BST41_03890 [Mycolicibacterium porcinum]
MDESTEEEYSAVEEFAGDNEAIESDADSGEAAPDPHVGDGSDDGGDQSTSVATHGVDWMRVLVYGVLPGVALVLGLAAGLMKWMDSSARAAEVAGVESVQAAKDSTVALLSYKPESVERDLGAARDLLTGDFRDSYAQLTDDVVIPGSKQKQISAVATVPAAASVSANPNHAVVIVFVNQTTTIGQDRPTDSASSVRVTLDKVGDRWLVSGFDPV